MSTDQRSIQDVQEALFSRRAAGIKQSTVRDVFELSLQLPEDAAGTTLTVEYLREGKAAKVSVVLAERIAARWPGAVP